MVKDAEGTTAMTKQYPRPQDAATATPRLPIIHRKVSRAAA